MAQFDVYRNTSPASAKRVPYLVEVQGNYCDIISTCVVIPLVKGGVFTPVSVLNPSIDIEGVEHILSTAEITTVLRSKLGRPIGALKHYHVEIIKAIDRLLQ